MTILLTGGAGFIGSHTYVELVNAGHDAVIVDDFSNSSPKVLERLAGLLGHTPECHQVDVGDAQALAAVFARQRIDAAFEPPRAMPSANAQKR